MAVHAIALDDLARLAIDDASGRWYVEAAIIAGSIAAVIAAIWPIVRFFLGGG